MLQKLEELYKIAVFYARRMNTRGQGDIVNGQPAPLVYVARRWGAFFACKNADKIYVQF